MYHSKTAFTWRLILLINLFCLPVFAQVSSESDLKKEGEKYFIAEDYENALPDYSRLLSLYPDNTEYLYRFGVCQILAGKDKSGAVTYLEKASEQPKAPDEVWFYLGKSYLAANEFSKAKDAFNKFKTVASAGKLKKFDTETYLSNAENGEQLIKVRKNAVTMKSVDVARSNFYSSYDFSNSPGKIVNASEEFYSQLDRAKQKDAVMFMSNDKQTILISSYGTKGDNGKDIYIIRRLADGSWSKAQNLGVVNSPKDEDYPFLDRDGKTLYFSSCGHNSMGGYDIFKSVFDFNTGQWSEPENMGVPINSVYDELLFVPQDNKNAIYSTNVESDIHSISVRNVEIPDGLSEMLTISGEYIPLDQHVRRDARITVLTGDGKGIISSIHTDPVTGKYDLVVAPGQTYMLVVEGGGYVPHAESFELPAGLENPVLKQVVKLDKEQQKEEMTLENYFNSNVAATQPTSVHHSFADHSENAKMISITINNEVVNVPAPEVKEEEVSPVAVKSVEADHENVIPAAVPEADAGKSSEEATALQSTDKSASAEGNATVEEVQEDTADVTAGENSIAESPDTESVSFSKDITNAELAKIAFEDAREMQAEADSMRIESIALKKSASDIESYAVQLSANGTDSDSAVTNQVSLLRGQAVKFRQQAEEIDLHAAGKQKEADDALVNANEILKSDRTAARSSKHKNKNVAERHAASGETEQKSVSNHDDASMQEEAVTAGADDKKTSTSLSSGNSENSESDSAKAAQVITRPEDIQDNKDIQQTATVPQAAEGSKESSEQDAQTVVVSPENSVTATEVESMMTVNGKPLTPDGEPGEFNEEVKDAGSNAPVENTASKDVTSISEAAQSGASSETLSQDPNASEVISNTNAEVPSSDLSVKAGSDVKGNAELDETIQPSVQAHTDSAYDAITNYNPPAQNSITNPDNAANTLVNSSGTADSDQKNITADEDTEQKIQSASDTLSPAAVDVKADDKNTSAAAVNAPAEPGESPKTVSAFDANDFPGYSQITVKEEAKTAYRNSQAKLEESNSLSDQSLRIQDQISHLKSSPQRDSLIGASNEMMQKSMDVWHEGLTMLEEARRIEPNIDYKMGVIDFASRNGSGITEGSASYAQANNDAEANAVPAVQLTDTPVKSQEKLDPVVESKEDTASDQIDTTHPDYPLYAKLQKDITDKQVETIDVFAEAINLSRKASDETDEANKLLDQAQMETDSARKAALTANANELKALAATHEEEAKGKFGIAKGHTMEVKTLVAQMKEVKQRITLQPGQQLASAEKSNMVITGSGKELSAGGGLSVVEEPANKKMDAQTFAMAERENSGLNATEDEIASVNITAEQKNSFLNSCFNRTNGSYYSSANPVPMDPSLPEGLVFKIQIGAFRNPLPAETFKGLQPLSGETTRPGWIRYCVGLFRTFEPANTVKNEIKKSGYKDAFVVAYYNGKRIELNDAYTIIRNKENVTAYRDESAREMAILQSINIRPFAVAKDKDVLAFYARQPLPEPLRENDEESIKALSEIDNGTETVPMQYTVQLGVFKTASPPQLLSAMNPLPASKVKDGVFRYTTMTFDNRQSADSVKEAAVKSGIADAFVVGVKNGKIVAVNNSAAGRKQKWNDVVKDEVPSADPVYKVQIGAFRNDVPYNIIEAYLTISDKGITRLTDERGLHIFYAGSFKEISAAAALRQDIVSKGIKDAFVVVLQNGKRISIPQ